VITDEPRLLSEIELALHSESDKASQGRDCIGGSINDTLTEMGVHLDSNDENRLVVDRIKVNGSREAVNGSRETINGTGDSYTVKTTDNDNTDADSVIDASRTSISSNKNDDNNNKKSQVVHRDKTDIFTPTTRSIWRRRNARSAVEGIRSEKTTQLSNILAKADLIDTQGKHYAAKTITGLINALAEEAVDLDVEVDARRSTPLWGKHVDAVTIKFSRLGFKPLKMGGLDDTIKVYDEEYPNATDQSFTRQSSDPYTADEAFDKIDVDKSGNLDPDEIAQALTLAALSPDESEAPKSATVMKNLASELVQLYDFNGDGVVDRTEYQNMVEDMAALRQAQKERQEELQKRQIAIAEGESDSWLSYVRNSLFWWTSRGDKGKAAVNGETKQNDFALTHTYEGKKLSASIQSARAPTVYNMSAVNDSAVSKALGSITLSDLKLDLRRLFFGAVPILKHITPGGPLILEPFTATITGSFNREDMKSSFLLDAGLRRLVALALRRRVRFFRDFIDGAVFYGRSWKDTSASAPVVEVPEVSDIEFDKQNRLIITGRAKIRTRKDAPKLDQAFKVRTKIGTRMDGQFIRLVEPELAFVLECPKSWERK
jgi:EF-hand domain pair